MTAPPTTRRPVTQSERNALVVQYLPLVRHVVARMPIALPRSLDREDLHSAGVFGLMHAAEAYDAARGASFKTFAYLAIRGSVLDEVRRHDPVPRPRRERLRAMDRANSDLREILGRTPTIEELAERMGVRAGELEGDLDVLHGSRTFSLEDLGGTRAGRDDSEQAANLPDRDGPDPSKVVETRDQVDQLARAIAALPEPDRKVIVLYHHEGLYLKEIGDILGVTESRVCQILARATARLRRAMTGSV